MSLSPREIASACAWTAGALRVELNKGLYRYIESLTGNPVNSLRWEKVSEWLELKGYKLQTPAPLPPPLH